MATGSTNLTVVEFELRGEFIALNALIKAVGLTDSGGSAKGVIAEGTVRVNGDIETRRRRKIRAGDRVLLGETEVHVLSPATAAPDA